MQKAGLYAFHLLTRYVALFFLLIHGAATGQVAQTFFGSTPCDNPVVRNFLNVDESLPCEQMKWKLILTQKLRSGFPEDFVLSVSYGMSLQNTNGLIDGGTKTIINGTCKIIEGYDGHSFASVIHLRNPESGAYISLVKVNKNLLHLLGPDNRLAIGNAAWSYTLNNIIKNEEADENSTSNDPESINGVFEGKTPCREIAPQLQKYAVEECIKLKWRIFFDKTSMTYKMDGSFYREKPRLGKFTILKGVPGNPKAVTIQLDPDHPGKSLYLLKGDNNILFFLDNNKKCYVGNEDFSYTLNRVR